MRNGIEGLQAELEKRLDYPVTRWGRKQEDEWDRMTNFIYRVYQWDALLSQIAGQDKAYKNYAINRWFNYWSAVGVERLICNLPEATPNTNKFDRLVDFTLNGIRFDHKTTVYPRAYGYPLEFALSNPGHLAQWLYENQSKGQRFGLNNRLFVVLHSNTGDHWKLRASLDSIDYFLSRYFIDDPSPLSVNVNGAEILCHVVFVSNKIDDGLLMSQWAYTQQ